MRFGAVAASSVHGLAKFLFRLGHEALGQKFVAPIQVITRMGCGIGLGETLFGGRLHSHKELRKVLSS